MSGGDDFDFASKLTGKDKVELLLREKGYDHLSKVAKRLKEHRSDVTRTLNNEPGRPGISDRIRFGIAKLAGVNRDVIDDLLGPLDEDQRKGGV